MSNIMDQIKSFEDACNMEGVESKNVLPYDDSTTNPEQKAVNDFRRIMLITKVLNQGWKPNWQDNDERKYQIWFDMSRPSGLVLYDVDGYYSLSNVSSRLCFKTRALAEYAGKQFTDIYKGFMVMI